MYSRLQNKPELTTKSQMSPKIQPFLATSKSKRFEFKFALMDQLWQCLIKSANDFPASVSALFDLKNKTS